MTSSNETAPTRKISTSLRKDGPVAVARFELGDGDEPGQREARFLRQRGSSDVMEQLLPRILAQAAAG